MTINCVIVEDEPLARRLLEDYVKTTPSLQLLKSFGNPLEALEFLKENEVDLLFSDIQMKEITGITLLRLLQKKPVVILTTAYSEYAIEGYELDVVDYLLKPITFERFLKGVEKASSLLKLRKATNVKDEILIQQHPGQDFIFLKDGSKLLKVKLSEILYIQSLKDYVRVFTKEKQIVSLHTMKSLEEILPKHQFIRIHNSTIVAFEAIEEIERDAVKIKDQYLPVSESYKKAFREFVDEKKL